MTARMLLLVSIIGTVLAAFETATAQDMGGHMGSGMMPRGSASARAMSLASAPLFSSKAISFMKHQRCF